MLIGTPHTFGFAVAKSGVQAAQRGVQALDRERDRGNYGRRDGARDRDGLGYNGFDIILGPFIAHSRLQTTPY